MVISGARVRDHGFHRLRIRRVEPETAEASSFVLDVPADLRRAFAYEAGQFCTFRVWIDHTPHLRCYSMSSSPDADVELAVTVKRVPGGLVSNRMLDTLTAGDEVEVTCPAGVFCLDPRDDADVVAFAAGSGITPVFSLVKTALTATERRVRLLYANRDRDAVIFRSELEGLAEWYASRLEVVHRYDVEDGFVDGAAVASFAGDGVDAAFYLCGPTPFMDIVEGTLAQRGVAPARVHVERFAPADAGLSPTAGDGAGATQVTIELDGREGTTEHHPGTTILQVARQLGLPAPFSCESGSCATCMARLVEGTVEMYVNNALTDDEVAEGWVLTCQSVPTSPSVHVVYGYEEG
jgi:3-ketosteroid 9alpha-monooxygenase subunit B